MISSSETLQNMERAVRDIRKEEDRLTAVLNSASEEAARLRTERTDIFRSLARMRLDTLRGETVVGELDAAEREALDLLKKAKEEAERLMQRRADAAAAVTAAEGARHSCAAAVEAALHRVDELSEATEARIKTDAAWQEEAARVADAESLADEAAKKATQSETDRDEKRKPYDADPLFVYLWERGYGTSRYKAGSLARYGDTLVADLIAFDRYRPNFWMLNEIPRRLREHANRLEAEAEKARARLEAIERKALEADGILPLEQDLKATRERLLAAEKVLAEAQSALAAIDEEVARSVEGGKDRVFDKAIGVLAQSLAREDLAALHREALATPAPEDERLTARAKELEEAIARADREVAETRATAREVSRRRAELESAREDFRHRGYNDPYGTFSNEQLIAQVIAGIIGGVMRGSDLGRVFHDGYSRRAPRSDPFFGGSQWPGGGGSRRRFGGSFGSGGRIGGGGFKTGGKF
ncbi:MAG: hypothetical protein HXY22_09650 [Alphaproteobacteria bacterium]|nr:hypothetical protein [Alphaproteobacteria bacterium]